MDTHALVLALRAIQMEIRALTFALKPHATDDEHGVCQPLAEADRLMDEAEKAARPIKVTIDPKLAEQAKRAALYLEPS